MTSALVPFLACGGDEAGSGPPPLTTGTTPPPPDDAGSSVGQDVLEATTTTKTFKGSLATTKTVRFGGDPYCEYTMTIKQIEIEILFLENGEVGLARVRNQAVETSVPPCPHPPMDPSSHDYALKGATKTATGVSITLVGATSNRPDTSLVLDLVTKGDGFDAAATWKRLDQKAPLDWVVNATVPLAQQ